MNNAKDFLFNYGAVKLTPMDAPFLHKILDGLVEKSNCPKPDLYITRDKIPNAMAIDDSSINPSICIHVGLIETLNQDEIEAVIAHELGHLVLKHSEFKTRIALSAQSIILVGNAIGGGVLSSGYDFAQDDNNSGDLVNILVMCTIAFVAKSATTHIAKNKLVQASHQAEFQADNFSGELTGKPWAMIESLKKMDNQHVDGKRYSPEIAQLFFSCPSYLKYETHPSSIDRFTSLRSIPEIIRPPENYEEKIFFCNFCGHLINRQWCYCTTCGAFLAH